MIEVAFGTGTISVEFEDEVLSDESGDWVIAVDSLGGADCSAPYTLTVRYDDGW